MVANANVYFKLNVPCLVYGVLDLCLLLTVIYMKKYMKTTAILLYHINK